MRQFGIVEKVVESTIYVCNACHDESYEETTYDATLEEKDGKQTGNVIISYYSRCAKCKEFFHDNQTETVTNDIFQLMEEQRINEERNERER